VGYIAVRGRLRIFAPAGWVDSHVDNERQAVGKFFIAIVLFDGGDGADAGVIVDRRAASTRKGRLNS